MLPEGDGSMFCMLEGRGGHTDSIFVFFVFFDQFSCIKFFDLSYGLKDIDFQSLKQFKSFLEFLLLFKLTLSRTVPDRWDPYVSL